MTSRPTATTTEADPEGRPGRAVDYITFDADNHYYEATDAFTRYIDPAMAKRAMQWAEIDGRRRLLVGGAVNRFIPNPTFDPVAKPGSLDEYFRGRNPGAEDIADPVRRPRADPSRVPGPRRPAGRHGRPGHRRLLPLPHPRCRHGGGTGP